MADDMVLGERLDDLAAEMLAMSFEPHEDGTTRVDFTLKDDASFFRALRRAEALAIMSGDRRAWNTETRQYDAFLVVIERVKEAVKVAAT
jgi:hypothetical protein